MQQSGLQFLLPYMRAYRRHLAIGTLYALVGAAASAFSPTWLGWGVDALNRGVSSGTLARYALGLILLAVTVAFFRYLLRMLTGEIAAGITYRMSQDLFHRLLLFDRETRQKYGTGDLLSRSTSDFIYIWRFYSAGFQMAIHAFFLLLIGCGLMAMTSPSLAGLVVVTLTVSIAVQVRLGRILERSFAQVQQEIAKLAAFVQEHLQAARMLTAYVQEAAVVDTFRAANQRYVDRNLRFVLLSGAISPLPSLMVRLAATVVVFVGGMMIIGRQLTVGQYVQFIVYLGLLNSGAQQITDAFTRMQQGGAAAGRIGEVLHRWPKITDTTAAKEPQLAGHVRFENVGVWAEDQDRWALRHINLEIPAGTTLGIVGPTGSGKSMLISLLGRIYDPDEGRVLIDGHDLREIKLAKLRQSVVYVPQESLLFSMPLRNNIALGAPRTPDSRIYRAMDQARLSNDLSQLPKGLDSYVGERGSTLSGGQKQRTAIARALVRDPRILLLDDALASIDMKTASEILLELRQTRTQRTCVIVTQRLAAVQDADQIVVLDHGRIVERGTHADLIAHDGFYAEMYHREVLQAEEETHHGANSTAA
ncbi:MAG: ABC transporter ATP-binding protein [Caldilineaceae bacterium]|nr:ABC transporter ATP-binding protein [Caldilineaceae bacterium]